MTLLAVCLIAMAVVVVFQVLDIKLEVHRVCDEHQWSSSEGDRCPHCKENM